MQNCHRQGRASIRVFPILIRRKVGERTVNVTVLPEIIRADNGARVHRATDTPLAGCRLDTDGHYFRRVSDESKPVVGDEVMRLAAERSALPWETQTTLHVSRAETDPQKLATFVAGIRASDRVKESVKERSEDELLDHYMLAHGEWLTNLGISLCRSPPGSGADWHCAGDPVHQVR